MNKWRVNQSTAKSYSTKIAIEELASKTQQLYYTLCHYREKRNGKWEYSPVEEWKKAAGYKLFKDKIHLMNFRRSKIASGTINFPDRPRGELPDLWLDGLPWKQKIAGFHFIRRLLAKLRTYTSFKMKDLNDTRIGNPCLMYYPPNTLLTEAQIRFFYYKTAIAKEFGKEFGNILEIGAGFGGLCGEILNSFSVDKYFIIDLPENLCLTFWYLSQLSNSGIQVIYDEKKAEVSNNSRVILIAPWILPLITEEMDLLINTMSFQHMTMENLEYYFYHIERLNTKKMYLVNRNTKRDPTDVIIDHYPITRFNLIRDGAYLFSAGKAAHKERYYRLKK